MKGVSTMVPLSKINRMQNELLSDVFHLANYSEDISDYTKAEISNAIVNGFGKLHLNAFNSANAIMSEAVKYSFKLTHPNGTTIYVDISDITGSIFKQIYMNESKLYATDENGFMGSPRRILGDRDEITDERLESILTNIAYFVNQNMSIMQQYDKLLSNDNPEEVNEYITSEFILNHKYNFLSYHVSKTSGQSFVKFTPEIVDTMIVEVLDKKESAKLFNKQPDQSTIILSKGSK